MLSPFGISWASGRNRFIFTAVSCFWRLISAVFCGLLAVAGIAPLLWLLDQSEAMRAAHPMMYAGLPLVALGVHGLYFFVSKSKTAKSPRVLDGGVAFLVNSIRDEESYFSPRVGPFIFVSTWLSHLCGASVGREGSMVQWGASMSSWIAKFGKKTAEDRMRLLVAGAAAGFGCALGAPLAGAVFGLEFSYSKKHRPRFLVDALIASYSGHLFYRYVLGVGPRWPRIDVVFFSFKTLILVLALGVLLGLVARFIVWSFRVSRRKFLDFPAPLSLKLLIGSLILSCLFLIPDLRRYSGLSLDLIENSFTGAVGAWDPFLKYGFTLLSLTIGFKGGEFIPLVLMGSNVGSLLAVRFNESPALFAGLGFGALFGAASKTPVTCVLMMAELFGWFIAPWALLVMALSFWFSGGRGIYQAEQLEPSN